MRRKCLLTLTYLLLLICLCCSQPRSLADSDLDAPLNDPSLEVSEFLAKKYSASPSLLSDLIELAKEHEHGTMILAIMAVESGFRPDSVSKVGALGLGQINPIHLSPKEIRDARNANRPTLVDACQIEQAEQLLEPELNFCATSILYGSLLERRGSVEKALYDYVGSRGAAGRGYARRVLQVHEEIIAICFGDRS